MTTAPPRIIAWEPPPEDGRGKNAQNESPWHSTAGMLKRRPGQWALLIEQGPVRAAARALKKFGCEVTTRKHTGKDRADLYARYPDQETTR